MENKQIICNFLATAIRGTRAGSDLRELTYNQATEEVHVYFGDDTTPSRVINVAHDSGMALIKDVVNHIDI